MLVKTYHCNHCDVPVGEDEMIYTGIAHRPRQTPIKPEAASIHLCLECAAHIRDLLAKHKDFISEKLADKQQEVLKL